MKGRVSEGENRCKIAYGASIHQIVSYVSLFLLPSLSFLSIQVNLDYERTFMDSKKKKKSTEGTNRILNI